MESPFIREIKENTKFQTSEKAELEYLFQAPEYLLLEEKYNLSGIAGKNDLEKILNLLAWN